MAKTKIGKVSPVPRGEYNNTNQYEKLDIVSKDGGSWIAKKPVRGVEPGTDPESWMRLAEKGDTGEQGETGATPQLTIGTVTTLDPGEDASASITGTAEAPVLGR